VTGAIGCCEELLLPGPPAPPEALPPNRPCADRPAISGAAAPGGSQGHAGAGPTPSTPFGSCAGGLRRPRRCQQDCRQAQDADDPEVAGLDIVRQDAPEGSTLWIHDDEHGDAEAVIRFVLRLAEELDLTGLWGFQYALTCSRPRLDAFGGGVHVIDLGARKSIGWTSTHEWLAASLNGEDVDA